MTTRVRMTVLVRQTAGLTARMQAKTRAQRAAVLEAAERDRERTFARAQSECPRDTHYMALHMVDEPTRGGFHWAIGFRRRDFVGHTNPADGRVITAFYPVFVIHGTRRQAGNNFLRRAYQDEAANRARGFRRALGAAA